MCNTSINFCFSSPVHMNSIENVRNTVVYKIAYCIIMVIFSEKCLSSVTGLPDDDFITRGWHEVSKSGGESAEEPCKAGVIDLSSDNRDNGLYVMHWQFLNFSSHSCFVTY